MKKKAIKRSEIKYFSYKSKENIESFIKDNPIILPELEELIDRVHIRYPIIPKSDVARYAIAIFELLRKEILFGGLFSFNLLFKNLYLKAGITNGYDYVKFMFKTSEKMRRLGKKSI